MNNLPQLLLWICAVVVVVVILLLALDVVNIG